MPPIKSKLHLPHASGKPVSPTALALLLATIACPALFAADHTPPAQDHLLGDYCSDCHNDEQWAGGLSFAYLSAADFRQGENLAAWEKILRKTSLGEMPPKDEPQPDAATMQGFTHWLESSLDGYAKANPNPGRATLRRLNRAEYANAVRDLLALEIDVSKEMPADDSGYGFDNIADVLTVSPTLMDRYLAVAGKISRRAVGLGSTEPTLTTYQLPKEGSIMNQGIPAYNERASDKLPIDSRGGGAFDYFAPQDGTYVISGYLNANTNNEVDRLPEDRISLEVPLAAGPHSIGITFRKQHTLDERVQVLRNTTDVVVIPPDAPTEVPVDFVVDGARVGSTTVQSYQMRARFSQANFPRDVLQIDVEGPFNAVSGGDTPSRRKIFSCRPDATAASESACAREILASLARQAYRRPVSDSDIEPLLRLYTLERDGSNFEQGVAAALQALLVSPGFLFLHESDAGTAPGSVHPISDLEFASRLALFLWSSLPDEELLTLAEQQQLREPAVLQAQLARMLSDPKADAFTTNFAGQWLYLRNLAYQRPDVYLFPQYDTRLRMAMQRESELFFDSIVRENRSALDFLAADYTYLNQQLAEHYGIEGVKGTAFRRVKLDPSTGRGGLLGQASILTVTSYGNHTSVVRRGKWILENLLASPPPPPPPDVPALKTTNAGRQLNAREQMELHRSNPVCSSCHVKMDAMGFALENFDAIGKWRTEDAGRPLDVSARMPNGTPFEGPNGLRTVLLERKQEFLHAFSERLLTYALGRGIEAHDQSTLRAITRSAAPTDYRLHSLILAVVQSEPFNLRKTPE